MKIAAWSDGHGTLPKLTESVDVLLIAGDIVPLYKQRHTGESLEWFANDFLNYVRKTKAKKVIFTPGNHDFLFENISPSIIKEIIENNADVKDKLIYLLDEEYEYKGFKFYGTPWVTGLTNWAFYTADPEITYNHIPDDCDILISHMPPKVDRVGCSNPYTPYERNYGSDNLREAIDTRDIKYVFCGHIHTGTHDGVPFGKTTIYNVSLKNEDYKDVYDVTYVEI